MSQWWEGGFEKILIYYLPINWDIFYKGGGVKKLKKFCWILNVRKRLFWDILFVNLELFSHIEWKGSPTKWQFYVSIFQFREGLENILLSQLSLLWHVLVWRFNWKCDVSQLQDWVVGVNRWQNDSKHNCPNLVNGGEGQS